MHLVVCSLLLCLFACQITALSKNETIDILLKFKSSLTNDTGDGFSDWNWKNSRKMCSWSGITCDSTGAVVEIYLNAYEHLDGEGSITPALGNLSSLTHLSLYSLGSIGGMIPPELGKLHNLTDLNLYGSFSGMIPPQLGKLHNLQSFSVGLLPGFISSPSPDFDSVLEIPAEFGQLGNLKFLTVYGLKGKIPESLGNLTTLQELHLDGKCEGEFPPLQRLHQLQTLYISVSSPNCRMDIRQVANLTAISDILINGIFLRGSLPAELGQLQQLRTLQLWNNWLGGDLPNSLGNCSALSELTLGHNDFTGGMNDFTGRIPPELGLLPLLSYLRISYTKVSGSIPSSLGNLTALQYLSLDHNNLTGTLPWQLGELQGLSTLDLSSNAFSGFLPAQLGQLMNLETLDLSDNNFVGSIPSGLAQLPNLTGLNLSFNGFTGPIALHRLHMSSLDLSFNELNGTIPDAFCIGLADSSLSTLSLRHNNLSGRVPSFRNCTQLHSVDLSFNKFTGVDLDFQQTPYLLYISMAENSILGRFPKTLADCTGLQLVDFRKNSLIGNLPDFLGSMQQLRVLDLGYNLLEGFIPTWIGNMTQLQVLDLSNNKLQGQIPLQISKLKAFNFTEDKNYSDIIFSGTDTMYYQIVLDTKGGDQTYPYVLKSTTIIDLSNNSVTGNIPADIGDLRGLRFLLLKHNMLNGSMPASISKMLILEEIDFSYNRLTGRIPEELSKLSKLALVNLSFNQLSGPIPGGQFQTMDKSAYQGNKDLCGTPLTSCNSHSLPPSSIVNKNSEIKRKWWADVSWVAFALGLIVGLVLGLWLVLQW